MKELKTQIVDFRAKQRQKVACCQTSPGNNRLMVSRRESRLGVSSAIAPLQPQNAQAEQHRQCQNHWQRLATQAQRINKLATELETAMLELKAIAVQINCERHIQHNKTKTLGTACEFLAAIVPEVKRSKVGGFVLANRKVDLFRAEREATQVAQTLRRRTNRKRLVSHLSSYKRRFLGWLL